MKQLDQKGFTLIEVSMVIILLSFMMVPIFNFIMEQHNQEKRIATKEVNERILSALAIYLKNNGHYPCPAHADLNFGEYVSSKGYFARSNCGLVPSGAGIIAGDIPAYDLGLPYQMMYNGHGFKYLYAVTTTQTSAATFDGTGSIQIIDEFGNTIINNVPFVIVDMGLDGKGSIKQANGKVKNNSCDPPPGGPANTPFDSENCDNDQTFLDMPYSERESFGLSGYYDDVIFYDLARDESTLWMTKNSSSGGGVEITNRNTGNIGIGTYSAGALPSDKLEVTGGNVKVDTGNVRVGGKVQATTYCYDAAGC